ncbi:MAG TPA: NrfD/PsrC family molybdoenzyme membrane anchor subunit [Dehalococcoidales bacterium]|nr:NrfD/PsrC family molybdoenzyme membrane anchor subunit [Dehalococcoidales bacterium]
MARMATRQWMVTHEWMVKPMHQREWIERRGWMIWISEVFSSLGAGLFLVSLFMNSWWGLLAGWVIIMFLKLPIHVAYLGKPWRFYRLFPPFSQAWKTSWFARGVLFSLLFGILAFVQLVIGHPFIANFIGSAASPLYTVFAIMAGICALGVGIYGGFIMNYCKGIPFWNQGLLPAIFILAGVADGFGLIMGIALIGGDAHVAAAETGSRFLLLINTLMITVYLISAGYTSTVAKLSIRELIAGPCSLAFWGGIVLCGICIPATISIAGLLNGVGASTMLLIVAICSHTVGAFALKYCLLKVGIYRPLLSRTAAY